MTSLFETIKDKVNVVKTRVTWSYIETHLTKDKIIVIILIALQWGFATTSSLLYFILPENQKAKEDLTLDANNISKGDFSTGCNLTNIENVSVDDDCIYENFYFDNSTNSCAPNCYTWTSYEPAISNALNYEVLFACCVAALTSLTVLLVACFRRNKTLFQFPSVLVIYMSLFSLLRYTIIIAGYIDQHRLFCSSKDLSKNYITPTSHCLFAGFANEYYTVVICIWVFCHIFSIYFLLFHPYQANQFLKSSKKKYVHLCVVLVGLLAALLGPLTTILYDLSDQGDPDRLGYIVLLYPPHTCRNGMRKISFYTITLPYNILFAISVTLLILIFWKLLKGKQSAEVKIASAEKKILATVCYYVLLNYLVPLSRIILGYKFEKFYQEQIAFFKCASVNGISEPAQIKDAVNSEVIFVNCVLRPCFPFFLLAYVIDFKKLGKWLAEKKSMVFPTQMASVKSQSSIKSEASIASQVQ